MPTSRQRKKPANKKATGPREPRGPGGGGGDDDDEVYRRPLIYRIGAVVIVLLLVLSMIVGVALPFFVH